MTSGRTLLIGAIDYAGLFPPASFEMGAAVRAFAHYNTSDDCELLGRFILPIGRLDEFSSAASLLQKSDAPQNAWRLSVVCQEFGEVTASRIADFNSEMQTPGETAGMVCDAVEIPARERREVHQILADIPAGISVFIEIASEPDPEQLIALLGNTVASAKIRTGGVIDAAIPSPQRVLRFIRACKTHGVAFKATAGLHHATRGLYPLTYEPNAPTAVMHGYLNLLVASTFMNAGFDDNVALGILEETNPRAFEFSPEGILWSGSLAPCSDVEATRNSFALSFGSCSFTEPVGEARALSII